MEAFKRVTSLSKYEGNDENVIIPDDINALGPDCFKDTSVKSVYVPDSVTQIDAAFSECKTLEKIRLPKKLNRLAELAFYDCNNLKEVNIPSIDKLRAQTFEDCQKLEKVTFEEGLEEIMYRCFAGCYKIKSVTFPSSLRIIGDEAFNCCDELEEINLNEGLKYIGSFAFENVPAKTLIIPSTVEFIENSAFYKNKFETVIFKPNKEQRILEFDDELFDNCDFIKNIFVPKYFEDDESAMFVLKEFGNVIALDEKHLSLDDLINKGKSLKEINSVINTFKEEAR